jgi:UDP-2,4-diacetamido-2,4,6-trideoxy-beta-L-altropyranose hydrolase
MRVAFRADAALAIGTGHVMRCLTLADALRARGADCIFLSRQHAGHLFRLVGERGYDLHDLGEVGPIEATGDQSGYASWLGVEAERDLEETLGVLKRQEVDWLIVDHYGIGPDWEQAARAACRQLLAIDDLDRNHSADALLDQNLGKTADTYQGLVPPTCHLMLGPSYALLRPEFAALRPQSLARRSGGKVRTVLISMGGVDGDNATGAVLEALRKAVPDRDLQVKVILGETAPWRREVTAQAADMPFRTDVVVNARNMADLMCEADLAVGAAGSTTWERCCLGLPTLQMVVAENQREIARAIDAAGAARLVDRSDLADSIRAFMMRIERAPESLTTMALAAAAITDGRGAERVASQLEKVSAT